MNTQQTTQKFWTQKYFIGAVFCDFFIFDQLSKFFVRKYLEEPIEITSFFRLVFVENTGVAFSLPVPELLTITLAIAVIIFLGHQFITQKLSLWLSWAYVLIAAGAAGNLIDRLLYGAVTDFLSFWSFPIFNLADTWISLGVVCFLIAELRHKKTGL